MKADHLTYRDFEIHPHSHWPGHQWMWSHKDYDGLEDRRLGTAPTIEQAIRDIDEWYETDELEIARSFEEASR